MKTTLEFFASARKSGLGTLRGLVALLTLLVLDAGWFAATKRFYGVTVRRWWGAAAAYLLLCSAVGVQLPARWEEAALYGALVGFVTYGVFNGVALAVFPAWRPGVAAVDTLWGAAACCAAACVTYACARRTDLYP